MLTKRSDNQRVRARAVKLQEQTDALLFTYRAHRFPHLSGGTDNPSDRAATIRSKIGAGVLPRPADAPEKCWGGKGTRRLCHGCAVAIVPEEVEYELDIVGGGTLLFCGNCLEAWSALPEKRLSA